MLYHREFINEFIVSIWLYTCYLTFNDIFSSIALAKLLHHGITSNDSRLTEVTIAVEDESVAAVDADGGIRTRSQRGASHYRVKEISILVKILKLLIYELSNCLESAMAFGDDEDDDDDDGDVT